MKKLYLAYGLIALIVLIVCMTWAVQFIMEDENVGVKKDIVEDVVEDVVEEDNSAFNLISTDRLDYNDLYKIRDKESGCYYIVFSGRRAVSTEQMYINQDGISIPYCD